MNLQVWTGYWFFFLIPIALWFIGASFIRRKEFSAKYLAFVAGGDNRLSLSRLQAFAWTMVIFGSFFAAMAIHSPIPLINDAEVERLKSEAEFKEQDRANAQIRLEAATKNQAVSNTDLTQNELKIARQNYEDTAKQAAIAKVNAKGNHWVEIPLSLLALAGIAIGSGIVSNFISAVNNEEKTACVTGLSPIAAQVFNATHSDTAPTTSSRLLQIVGKELDKTGKVRLGKGRVHSVYASIVYWKSDGTEIVVEVPPNHPYDTLVVDTPNGKLCYELTDTSTVDAGINLQLGVGKYYYEFSDLFRDDKNPNNMDLMKFQMFGWTIIAILIYSWLFLGDMSKEISSLPIVPESIVILTGLSQAGYLAGKGVSNIGGNQN